MSDRKALLRAYKETPRAAGIYRVRNTVTGRVLIGPSPNLPGMLNRQRFDLEMGSHLDKPLQHDYNTLGVDAFTFDVLDELTFPEGSTPAPAALREELAALHELWVERLQVEGVDLYPWSLKG